MKRNNPLSISPFLRGRSEKNPFSISPFLRERLVLSNHGK